MKNTPRDCIMLTMLCASGTFDAFDKHKLSSSDAQWKYIAFLFPVVWQNWFEAPFCFQDIFAIPSYVCDLHNEAFKPTVVIVVFRFILWVLLTYSVNLSIVTESCISKYNTKLFPICHLVSWYCIIWTTTLIIWLWM